MFFFTEIVCATISMKIHSVKAGCASLSAGFRRNYVKLHSRNTSAPKEGSGAGVTA